MGTSVKQPMNEVSHNRNPMWNKLPRPEYPFFPGHRLSPDQLLHPYTVRLQNDAAALLAGYPHTDKEVQRRYLAQKTGFITGRMLPHPCEYEKIAAAHRGTVWLLLMDD